VVGDNKKQGESAVDALFGGAEAGGGIETIDSSDDIAAILGGIGDRENSEANNNNNNDEEDPFAPGSLLVQQSLSLSGQVYVLCVCKVVFFMSKCLEVDFVVCRVCEFVCELSNFVKTKN